jgi:hypothetical protein
MQKLYNVNVLYDIVVLAESEEEAKEEARFSMKEIDNPTVVQAKEMSYIPSGWDKKCLPWGGIDDVNIGDLIEKGAAPKLKRS